MDACLSVPVIEVFEYVVPVHSFQPHRLQIAPFLEIVHVVVDGGDVDNRISEGCLYLYDFAQTSVSQHAFSGVL